MFSFFKTKQEITFKKIKAKPFIRTNDETWGIASDIDDTILKNIPVLNNDIPVISCIGTSRDGKSTFLNLYSNWLLQKNNENIIPFEPFIAKQSDEAVTNGIDYFHINNKCILFDCQGMQLQNAKYDHYLTLITYLVSNVIILTVRQRLDLQVLNNLLSVFSFLSEIPQEFRRTDKPILIIRIKDFQNIRQLRTDENYLTDLVDKWLEKSNDQYDQIKEVFKATFDIRPIVTLSPKYDDINEEDQILDIYSNTFAEKNPSFIKACEKIHELSKNFKPCDLLKHNKMEKLVDQLKGNSKIDFRKLDLYHNITATELLEYGKDVIRQGDYIDKTIIDSMDGSNDSYDLYQERKQLINKLYADTYDVKFKDVPKGLKDERFKTDFDELYGIVETCKTKNIKLAKKIIEPYWDTFNKKFTDIPFTGLINGFVNLFTDKKKVFFNKLKLVDKNIHPKYKKMLKNEQIDLEKKQTEIIKLNKELLQNSDSLVDEYNIDKQIEFYTKKAIKSTNHNELSLPNLVGVCINIIIDKLNEIYKENNKVYHLNKNKEIIHSTKNYNIDAIFNEKSHYIWYNEKYTINFNDFSNYNRLKYRYRTKFVEYCSNIMNIHLTSFGFLGHIRFDYLNYLNFISFSFFGITYSMTETFFNDKFNDLLNSFVEENPYLILNNSNNDNDNNKKITIDRTNIDSRICNGVGSKPTLVHNMIINKFMDKLMMFCFQNNINLSK
jgi:hypothetical protein